MVVAEVGWSAFIKCSPSSSISITDPDFDIGRFVYLDLVEFRVVVVEEVVDAVVIGIDEPSTCCFRLDPTRLATVDTTDFAFLPLPPVFRGDVDAGGGLLLPLPLLRGGLSG